MFTFTSFKKGVTLIEMMIVMSIIGILASALYPQITAYVERSKILQYQTFAKEMIQQIHNYIAEWNDISRPVPAGWDWFCFSEKSETWCDTTWRHIGMSDYITKNSPKLHREIERLFNHTNNPYDEALWYENLSLTQYGWWWYVFPGRDMTSTKFIPAFYWPVPSAPWAPVWVYVIVSWGTGLGKEYDKLCTPWFATAIWWGDATYAPTTWCIYLFE